MDTKLAIKNIYDSLYIMRSNTLKKEKYINTKINDVPGHILVRSWKNEKNIKLKEQFEILIAKKLNSYNVLLQYNDVPSIYLDFLNEVTSIDAIIELFDNLNEEVKNIANVKYKEYFDKYLEENDKCKIIKFRRNL